MKSILLYLYKSNTDVNINFCWESLCIFEKYNFKNDKRTTIWFGCTLVVYRSSETSTSQSDVIIRSDDRFLSLVVDSDSIVSKIYMLSFVLWLVFFFCLHTDKNIAVLSQLVFFPSYWQTSGNFVQAYSWHSVNTHIWTSLLFIYFPE